MRTEEQRNIEREIRAKLALKQPLTARQRSYYLLYIATAEQAKEFIRNENKKVVRL